MLWLLVIPPAELLSRLKYMSELMLVLPWNRDMFASFVSPFSSPKNMSELIDLALPNLLTASLPPTAAGAGVKVFFCLNKKN